MLIFHFCLLTCWSDEHEPGVLKISLVSSQQRVHSQTCSDTPRSLNHIVLGDTEASTRTAPRQTSSGKSAAVYRVFLSALTLTDLAHLVVFFCCVLLIIQDPIPSCPIVSLHLEPLCSVAITVGSDTFDAMPLNTSFYCRQMVEKEFARCWHAAKSCKCLHVFSKTGRYLTHTNLLPGLTADIVAVSNEVIKSKRRSSHLHTF